MRYSIDDLNAHEQVVSMDREIAMRWNAIFFLVCSTSCFTLPPLQAAEVYRWIDSKGVSHYSQLPPTGSQQSFGKVNTAFTPAEQALIERTERQELERQNLQNKLLQEAALPPAAAGAAQTCRELQQDKVSYLKRRIEEQYHTSYNDCDISYAGTMAAAKRDACYQNAAQTMEEKLAALPSLQVCSDQ